jgi:hypothetical protein
MHPPVRLCPFSGSAGSYWGLILVGSAAGRRLDPLGTQVREKARTDLIGRPLDLGDIGNQPVRDSVRFGDAALTKSQRTANLIAVEPIRTTSPLIEGDLGPCDADLTRHVLHGIVRDFAATTREPATLSAPNGSYRVGQ